MLHRPRAAHRAIADEGGGLALRLIVDVGRGRCFSAPPIGVVVLGGHEDIAVELADLARSRPGDASLVSGTKRGDTAASKSGRG